MADGNTSSVAPINNPMGDEPYPVPDSEAATPNVASDLDFKALPEGSKYFGPDKVKRTKPYVVDNDATYMNVPEGAHYMGPDGITRQKPTYGDIGFSAEALYNMALTPEAKVNALKSVYGDRVKTDAAGPYVEEEDGKILRPGARSWKSGLGESAANTFPALGMGVGGLAGPGGAISGAMAGRQANNVILSLLGIHQPIEKQIESMGHEGAYTAGGEVLGRGVGKVAGWLKPGSKEGRALPNDYTAGHADAEVPAPPKDFGSRKERIAEDLGGILESFGISPEKGPFLGVKFSPKPTTKGMPNDYTMGLPEAPVPSRTKMPDASLDNPSAAGAFGSHADAIPAPESWGIGYQMPGARDFLGLTDEAAARVKSINERGGRVAPSVFAPDAPFLTKMEQFDAAFNKDSQGLGRFGQSARNMYEREGQKIVDATSEAAMRRDSSGGNAPEITGVVKESLTGSTEKVSAKKAGEEVVREARNRMAFEDADLERRINQARESALRPYNEAGGAEGLEATKQASKQGWEQSYQSNIEAANNLIRKGVDSIRMEADAAMREMAGRPGQTGDLVDNIANQFKSLNSVVRNRASHYYGLWEQASGGKAVDASGLADDAARFFSEMPEGLAGKYPIEIKLLNKLAAPEGEEAIQMGVGELHHLRSWMRHGINYDDLTPTIREGAMKHFETKVNKLLQGTEDSPLLNAADKFYRENIPYMDNEMIRATMRAIKGGTSIDPEVAANIFFKAGRSEDVREARKVLGPNLWNAVEAAHVQSLINKSKSLDGIDVKRLSGLVEQDVQKGILEMGYSAPKAAQLVQIARDIQHIDGTLSIPTLASDDVYTIMQKAQAAKLEAEAVAKTDPLKAFSDASKEFNASAKAMQSAAAKDRQNGQLGFLFKDDMPYKAAKAADRILESEDNIVAAANYFGRNSDAFNKLRQVYVHRFLQRELGTAGNIRAEMARTMPEEVQQLMFPGVTRKQMVDLAKDMEFMFGASTVGGASDIGGSLAGASRITNPSAHVPGLNRVSKIPGVDFVARIALGKYFAAIMEGVSHPEFMNWLTKSIGEGPAGKMAAKAVVNDRLKVSPWLGRIAGQYEAQPDPNVSQDRYAQ